MNKYAPKVKDRRMRMIWNSNATWVPSGYGIEQRDILTRFAKDGWPTAQIAFSGLEGSTIEMNDIKYYPKMMDTWGADAMVYHSRHFGANVVFTMQDVWTLGTQYLQQIPHWIPYLPIDQDPVPASVLNALKYAYRIITFSQFGHDTLQKHGFTSTLIKEGTDIEIFKPMDKVAAKLALGITPDKYVIGMVGANKENPPRKGWQQALEAFKMFHDKHPEAIFFFQTNQNSGTGFPIRQYAEYLGVNQFVYQMDEYLATFHATSDTMVKIYNAFDMLTHASLTEGFGLCIAEAQACGVPVVVNNCTSMPELIIPGVTGEVCDTGQKHFSNALGIWTYPDVNSLYGCYEKIFATDRKKMGEAARKNMLDNYDVDKKVKNEWIPYLEKLQVELMGDPPQLTNSPKTNNI